MKILKQLWYEGLYPNDTKLPTDSRYLKQLDTVIKDEDKLLSMLPDEAKEVYEQYTDSREELSVTDRARIFVSGFHLGAKIMLEVMEQEGAAKK